jgi:integrase
VQSATGVVSAGAVAVAAWRPRVFGPEAAAFARAVVERAGPVSAVRARSLLWACARLAAFGDGVGLALVPEVLLHPSVIERFVTVGLASAPTTRRRTVRTNLRFVARRAAPGLVFEPDPLALGRSRVKTPYTAAEIDAFLALADAQSTPTRRRRLSALVCLGAGAGLTGADLRHLRGSAIQRRHGGLVVVVEGRCPRMVPVLARFGERLWSAAVATGAGYVTGGVSASRHNVVTPVLAQVAGGRDLPRIEPARLRATWLATHAAALGLPALFAAAGVRHSQHVGDIVAALAVPDVAESVRLLGAQW